MIAAGRRRPSELLLSVGLACLAAGCADEPRPVSGDPQTTAVASAAKREATRRGHQSTKSPAAGPLPSFRMLGAEAGLAFERNDDIHGKRRIIEANGGGVAIFDFDGDDTIDITGVRNRSEAYR